MKSVSRGAALEVSSRVGTQVDWDQLDGEKLHAEVISLTPEEFGRRFTAFLKNGARFILGGFRLTLGIDRNMDGWKCVEPVEVVEGEFEPELQEFLREGESYVGGEEMVRRAKDRTGLRHAEAMLREQDKIPVDYRKYVLVFPEVWQGPDGGRSVFCLDWNGRRWVLGCGWLSGSFNSDCRLVRPRKYQK